MIIHVKYFGMIAEKINSSQETLEVDAPINLRDFFEAKFSFLESMNYQVAVNQQLTDVLKSSQNEVEVALLPPFAGG